MIITSDINKAKQQIKTEKKPVIILAQDQEFNRKILEYGKFEILLSIEKSGTKLSQRGIDSGFNEVLANIASKNKISIGIDLAEISTLSKKEKAIRLTKIIQNIKLCRKSKCNIKLLNYKDQKDSLAFLLSLGASTDQAKEALS